MSAQYGETGAERLRRRRARQQRLQEARRRAAAPETLPGMAPTKPTPRLLTAALEATAQRTAERDC